MNPAALSEVANILGRGARMAFSLGVAAAVADACLFTGKAVIG